MTAQQLTDDLKASGIAEFGLDASQAAQTFPSKYFDHSVTISAPDGSIYPRDPGHCATDFGAQVIASVFGLDTSALTLANAGNAAGLLDGWSESKLVPYLVFHGKTVNCGLLLQYFNHGYPPPFAMASANMEFQ